MASRTLRLGPLQASLFGTPRRLGLELSFRLGDAPPMAWNRAPAPPAPVPDGAAADLAARVASVEWYHTIELAPGVVTPGVFDHRPLLPLYQLPERLDGMRVLDVATFDGFWAFEFERRGAAEVVAIDVPSLGDVDLPPRRRAAMTEAELAIPMGQGFEIAREALGSRVRRERMNVYDLSPERLGTFDLVHLGDVLLHLRDPLKALWNLRRMTRGTALVSDVFNPDLDRHPEVALLEYHRGRGDTVWWRIGANTLRAMLEDAGFENVEEVTRFRYGGRGQPARMWHAVFRAGVAP